MLNKENYVSWSSCLLRYAKSKPNGKLIHNSILNGPYVRRMIPEPGDANREVTVTETFHVQTDDELSADDQAIQTILLGLPEDIYAAVDSCEIALEIWFTSNEGESIESYYHRFLKLMNDLKRNKHFPEKIASNLKFLNNLQPEWSRHVTIVHQTKDLHTADYTQLYDFLKYNQKDVDELKAEQLAKTQDPLAIMANSNNPNAFPAPHQDQSSLNQNYLQQPMPNLEDIIDPTTAMNMQYAGQNARNLAGYNEVIGNQVVHNTVQNIRVQNIGNQNGLIGVQWNENQNQIGNGNLMAARAEGNAAGQNGNQIRCYNCRGKKEAIIQLQAEEYDLMAAAADLEEIKEVNANYGSAENDNNVISEATSMEQGGETVEQHSTNFEETRALYESLYHNLAIKVKKVNSVNRKLKETNADLTTELARFKNQTRCFEISQEKYDKLERCYQQSVYQEQCLSKKINALHLSTGKQITTLNDEILDLNKQLLKEKSTVSFLLEEKKKLKSNFKTREDELLDKQIQLEKKIKELNNILLKTVEMSRDVLTVGSTMRIPLLYRGEYSQWVKRFMNYLEEQTDGEAMINSIKNGLLNDIYSLIDSNKTAKDLWDALVRHMLGSEYGEQDRKAAVLYEYETFKARVELTTKAEEFLLPLSGADDGLIYYGTF
nr:hypothetical protein [Tanacetum cinerariifolium]